jgi:predicted RecA/RadA family phage recombinase
MAITVHDCPETVEFTAPTGGVTLLTPVLLSGTVVIPCATAAAGVKFAGYVKDKILKGVAKEAATGKAWVQGQTIYWDNSGSKFTGDSTSGVQCGFALAAATAGATTGDIVLLND